MLIGGGGVKRSIRGENIRCVVTFNSWVNTFRNEEVVHRNKFCFESSAIKIKVFLSVGKVTYFGWPLTQGKRGSVALMSAWV